MMKGLHQYGLIGKLENVILILGTGSIRKSYFQESLLVTPINNTMH
jgi:hypothetical protein